MCLILIREPNTPLDFEDIKAACENNPHGWGYVIPDRGKLEVRRYFDPKGNDPEDVYTLLEEAVDKRIFLHLRWCTHGSRSKANVHPFPALQQRKDGMQVMVMHNGTVNSYARDGGMSDTYHFTEEVITPLLRRFLPATGKKSLLIDPFVNKVIDKFAAGWSKFVLVDNYGNYTITGDSGVKKEGYWLSNDYSFRSSYRTPAKVETTPYKHNYPTEYMDNYSNRVSKTSASTPIDTEFEEAEQCAVPFLTTNTDTGKPTTNGWGIDEEPLEAAEKTKFIETLGLKNLQELCQLTEPDLLDMVVEFPEVMTLLIRDILYELYNGR